MSFEIFESGRITFRLSNPDKEVSHNFKVFRIFQTCSNNQLVAVAMGEAVFSPNPMRTFLSSLLPPFPGEYHWVVGCYKFRMRLALNALSPARKLTQNTWSLMSSTQLIPSMTCAKRSGSRTGSGSSGSWSCSCGGACLRSSLHFVSSDGHVEMKWGSSSSCVPQFTRRVTTSLPVTPWAESAGVRLKAMAAKEKADPEVGCSG